MSGVQDAYLLRSREIVERCRALDAEIAVREAEKAVLLGERVELLLREVPAGSAGFEQAERSMFAEISAALHLSRTAAAKALGTGWALRDRFPATMSALAQGRISARHASAIVQAAQALDLHDHAAHAAYEEQVIPYAAAETPARTEAFARSVAASVSPRTITERLTRARAGRRVTVTDADDGMSWLSLLLPSPIAHAVHDRLTGIGRQIRMLRAAEDCGAFDSLPGPDSPQGTDGAQGPDGTTPPTPAEWEELTGFEHLVADLDEPLTDDRTLDQIRADIAADLLLAATTDTLTETGTQAIRGTVQVTIAATTLHGDDDRPAEHDGHGPADPALVRTLAADAERWDRLFLDPTGMLTRTDSYTPTERMRRHLRARDQHCRFPGCRMPARRTQTDHTHDHARGGPTDITNLACLCAGHHALKHPHHDDRWRWSATQSPDGTLIWTDPTGRTHTDHPTPRVQFV
ncbi:HNH endonuclease [Microbacterium resistens]|uniref:HNH endonuclease n=1 Tax=Microbacterium resistens TaxID=156977 RepID=A0ABY3RRP2_9MICO|nr:HNH endonuclease signature motif containing protein [Microbacterium resistens]UGS25162.1 HNH endonuclease [Microbacterium resistens]